MDEDIDAPKTPPNTIFADDSEEDEDNNLEPMVFDFGGPQSNQEIKDQALQETASFFSRSLSTESSKHSASKEPISFHFGPQAIEAPETEFVASIATGSKNQVSRGLRELAATINNRRRAATNRDFRGGATAYIDEDESGTYDPKKARRTPPSPSRPAKRVRISNPVDEDGNPKPKQPAKQIGFRYSLVVKLDFKGKKALDFLRTLPAGASGPPPGNAAEDIDTDDSGSTQAKKKREVKRPRRLGTTVSRSDGLTIDRLTNGHPQRRGCRCCFEQSNDGCSLIDHPDEYPCEACEDAGADCTFIVPPRFKKACLRCKDKRKNCSYSLDGGKGVNTCDACDEQGATCCAEPLTEPSMVRRFANLPARIRSKPITTTAAKALLQDRMYVACNQCRRGGKRCTNRGKADSGPCSNCRKANQVCKFVQPHTRTPQLPGPPLKGNKKTLVSSSRQGH